MKDTGSIIKYCEKITVDADELATRSLSVISDSNSHTDDENDVSTSRNFLQPTPNYGIFIKVLGEFNQDSSSDYVPSGSETETEMEDSGTDISQKHPRIIPVSKTCWLNFSS